MSGASDLPDFDGATYRRALDHARLGKQLMRVALLMADGQWRTLHSIAAMTNDPEASISARLRDLRKRKFGGHTVERERIIGGLYRYRIVLAGREQNWDNPPPAPVPVKPTPTPPAPAVQSDIFQGLTA
jgi:hypothetical protein